MNALTLYPAIDLLGGQVVRLHRGDRTKVTVYADTPGRIPADFVARGAQWIHVVDLDAAFDGVAARQSAAVREIVKASAGVPVQLGGGLRDVDTMQAAFDDGVSRLLIGTVAVEQRGLLLQALERFGAERIAVAVDERDGLVKVRGWVSGEGPEAVGLARDFARDGVRWLIVGQTNVALPSDMLMGLTAAGVSEFRGHSASFESVRHERRMVNQVPVRTELVSGSVIESSWMEIDSGGLRFSGIQARPLVRRDQVARILFHSIPGRLETRLRSGQPGVLLTTGDFIEGEVRSISEGTMLLDSVLFGQRRLDVVNLVLAVVMRPTEKPAFAYEVHTVDGSTWKALSVTMVDYGLSIQEPLIGPCVLPVSDLVSLELVR